MARYDGDTSLFMNDGIAPAPWWMSDDIRINKGTANDNVAVAGSNAFEVRLRMDPSATPFTGTRAAFELYLCEPMVAAPTPGPNNVLVYQTTILKTALQPAGNAGISHTFTYSAVLTSSGALAPGHKCLIGRLYPWIAASVPTDFQVVADKHEAQRNICVGNCASDGEGAGGAGAGTAGTEGGSPMSPIRAGLWEFRLNTTALTRTLERAVLRTTWVSKLPPLELRQLKLILSKRKGFKGFATEPPPKLGLNFKLPADDLPQPSVAFVPEVLESGRIKAPGGEPGFEARVTLKPGKVTRFGVTADLGKTPVGQAQILRVEQLGGRGRPEGGMTVAFLRVR